VRDSLLMLLLLSSSSHTTCYVGRAPHPDSAPPTSAFSMGQLTHYLWQLRRPDCLGLACAVTNTNAREIKPSGIDMYEQGGVLSIMDTTPALAEGTASGELAGGAEKATAAELEELEPEACGEAAHGHETPLQGEAGHEVEMLPRRANAKLTRHRKGARTRECAGVGTGRCDRAAGNLRRRNEWTRQRGSCLKSTVHAKVKSVIRHWYQHQKQPRTFTHTFAIPSRHRAAVPFSF